MEIDEGCIGKQVEGCQEKDIFSEGEFLVGEGGQEILRVGEE